MPHNEFDIIAQYFKQTIDRQDVLLGPGDDAAILKPQKDCDLLSSADTLVAGVHFLESTSAADIAYKSVAVSLSDIAAMGGEPAWLMLTLTMPSIDHDWLRHFCDGLQSILKQYHVALVGGDLTRGPLSITTQVTGMVKSGEAIKRSTAKPGDAIYITGSLGGAGYALHQLKNNQAINAAVLHRPTPRVNAGRVIREFATSAIDISDGLAADLSHILQASDVGAMVECVNLPLHDSLTALSKDDAWRYALTSGDDYELCFTVPFEKHEEVVSAFQSIECPVTKIGSIDTGQGLRLLNEHGKKLGIPSLGWQHF